MNQPCLTLLAATDRDLLSLLDAHLVRVTDSPPSRGNRECADRLRVLGFVPGDARLEVLDLRVASNPLKDGLYRPTAESEFAQQ